MGSIRRSLLTSVPAFLVEVGIFWVALEAFQQLNYGGRITSTPWRINAASSACVRSPCRIT